MDAGVVVASGMQDRRVMRGGQDTRQSRCGAHKFRLWKRLDHGGTPLRVDEAASHFVLVRAVEKVAEEEPPPSVLVFVSTYGP